jgi:hypothetical protein
MAITLTSEVLIGIFGSVLLILAWIWETYENYKKHKISIHLHFSLLYIAGNFLLVYYAWQIHSMIFFVLSIILMLAILGEIIYAANCKKTAARKIKR